MLVHHWNAYTTLHQIPDGTCASILLRCQGVTLGRRPGVCHVFFQFFERNSTENQVICAELSGTLPDLQMIFSHQFSECLQTFSLNFLKVSGYFLDIFKYHFLSWGLDNKTTSVESTSETETRLAAGPRCLEGSTSWPPKKPILVKLTGEGRPLQGLLAGRKPIQTKPMKDGEKTRGHTHTWNTTCLLCFFFGWLGVAEGEDQGPFLFDLNHLLTFFCCVSPPKRWPTFAARCREFLPYFRAFGSADFGKRSNFPTLAPKALETWNSKWAMKKRWLVGLNRGLYYPGI